MITYGIDANVLTRERVTGTERYVASLLKDMMKIPLLGNERVILYTSKIVFDKTSLPEGWEEKVLRWPIENGWTHGRLSLELLTRTPNVFFSPAHEIPMFPGRAKIVSTAHDVAFRKFPKIYSEKNRKRQEWSVARSMRLASKIITVSKTTKNDLIELYDGDEEKITPTPLAIYPERFNIAQEEIWRVKEKYHLGDEPFVLSVGRIEKKKNIIMLIRACVKADQKLILAGSYGHGELEIKQEIEKTHGRVVTLGYVPDGDLPGLVCSASTYAFPSRYEGFGIPALEAMAAGVPLIASDIPALREVVGNAALFAHPMQEEMWVKMLEKVTDDGVRRSMIQTGFEQLKCFSWDKTAKSTWQVLRSV